MATVLEECNTEEQYPVVPGFVVKRTQCKDIDKEMFLFTEGSVCHVKRFHNWVEKFSR
jgi:hypothetical protein